MPFSTQNGGLAILASPIALNSSTAVQILPDRSAGGRVSFVLQNQSAIDVFIGGDSTVTNSGGAKPGILLKGGLSPPYTFTDSTIRGPIWAIAASGTPALVVLEIMA
jgi:hypothetical protein